MRDSRAGECRMEGLEGQTMSHRRSLASIDRLLGSDRLVAWACAVVLLPFAVVYLFDLFVLIVHICLGRLRQTW